MIHIHNSTQYLSAEHFSLYEFVVTKIKNWNNNNNKKEPKCRTGKIEEIQQNREGDEKKIRTKCIQNINTSNNNNNKNNKSQIVYRIHHHAI